MINIKDILSELSLEALKEVSRLKGIKIESRKKIDYIEELSAYEWSETEINKLIEIFKRDREKSIRAIMIYVFRSSDLQDITKDNVKSALEREGVDFSMEEIYGFRIIKEENNIISCEYWYTQKKIILDDTGKIHYFKMPSQIKFDINLLDGLITIYAINPGLSLKCKKSIEDALEIEMYPISPLEVD